MKIPMVSIAPATNLGQWFAIRARTILLTAQLFLGQLAILILVAMRECFGKVLAVDELKAKDGGDNDQVNASHDVVR